MSKQIWKPGNMLYPLPAVLVTAADRQGFLYAFFPFLFGIYPYTAVTEKQREAMELARVERPGYSIYEIVSAFVQKMLRPFS